VNMFNMQVALYTIYTAYELQTASELNNTSLIIFTDDYCGVFVYP